MTTKEPRARHRLSEIDEANRMATCSVCGPDSPLLWGGKWLCRTARRETKRRSNAQASAEVQARRREAQRRWIKDNAEHRRAYHFRRKYGITEDDYQRLLRKQKGKCGICGGPPAGPGSQSGRFHVDHCHDTGRVRGLLCGRCNTAIGLLNHSPAIVQRAADWVS